MGTTRSRSVAALLVLAVAMILTPLSVLHAASDAAPIDLKFANMQSPKGTVSEMFCKGWANAVEKATDGRVKVTLYWNQALGKASEQYNTAVKGVADVTYGYQSWSPGRFPLTSGLEMPFLFPSGLAASRAAWEMYTTSKFLKPEYKDVKVLGLCAMDPKALFFAKKPVHSLEDLKGMKIRVQGLAERKTIELLGATPVAITITELYNAMERGIVDGTYIAAAPIYSFRFDRVIEYAIDISFSCGTFFLVMNRQTWDGLPPDIQEKVDGVSGLHISEIGGKAFDIESAKAWEVLEKKGVERYRLPPDEYQRWKDAVAPITDWWIAGMEAKGLPGKEAFEEIRRLSKKYSE